MAKETIQGYNFSLQGGNRIMEIASDEVVQLFDGVSIKAPDPAAEYGMWSLASVGNRGEIKYNSFKQPKHILQARNGCVWNPKMRFTQVGGKMVLSPYTINGEICPDAFWESSFEKIFGTGLDIRNFYATPEGRSIIDLIVAKIFLAMHNGVYDVMHYGSHPLIASADENQYYLVEVDEWVDYQDQMGVSDGGGVLTQLDGLRDNGVSGTYPHLKGAIASGDITDGVFDGSSNAITTYFDWLINNAHYELQLVRSNNRADFAIYAHPAEFDAYEQYLMTQYTSIPASLYFMTTGANGEMQAQPDVLMYKGSPVFRMNGWKRFDMVTGYNVHRIVAAARGVFGAAYDVATLPGSSNTGLRFDQRMGGGEGHMGKIYTLGDLKLGTEILDTNLVAMTSIVDTP